MENKGSSQLWGGRFASGINEILEKLNSSIEIDKIMWQQDITGSIMYSRALTKCAVLTTEEQEAIEKGLIQIEQEWKEGKFIIKPNDEDIHTANERRLKELIGPVGGKLHTGRSRNDQVALDTRMWLKDHLVKLSDFVKQLILVLIARAEADPEILMPGYTHLQRAQAIRWSHWLLSHAWFLNADLHRLKFVFWSADACPLGSGALAGNPFAVDREEIAKNLNFSRITPNSLLAVADRDFIAEYLFWCSLTSCHLSRLAEDLILYSTSEFKFVTISDAFSTGSSLMPQKKNPDSLELIRGKAGRMIGNVTGFLAVLKGLPSTYNKDLQEDKALMLESAATLEATLQVAAGTISSLKINKEACLKGLTEDMLATDLAYFLVRAGIPFREAHGKAGEVVRKAEELKCSLSEIPLEEMQKISPKFTSDVSKIWSFENSVEQYSSSGGTALVSVIKQIEDLKRIVNSYDLKANNIA